MLGTVASGVDVATCPALSEIAPVATIHNLVGTCEIQSSITPIDLELVYRSLANSFYCRRRFAAITIRVTDPVCTGLLFTSGKLVITGCKTHRVCLSVAEDCSNASAPYSDCNILGTQRCGTKRCRACRHSFEAGPTPQCRSIVRDVVLQLYVPEEHVPGTDFQARQEPRRSTSFLQRIFPSPPTRTYIPINTTQ